MTIAFFTSFINHHQVGVADELYRLTDGNYYFICTSPLPDSFSKSGYPDYFSRPYVIKAYNSKNEIDVAMNLAKGADVAIFGGIRETEVFRDARLKLNKLSFEYGERWLKKGLVNILSPRLLKLIFKYHFKYPKDNYYALCASAYASSDLNRFGMFKNKCYKWGYFTEVDSIAEDCFKKMQSGKLAIMWCARFIDWKHPEMPVLVASKLRDKGIDFSIDMFGSGPMYKEIELLIKKYNLQDVVHLKGNVPNSEIRHQMQEHDIFLFTSDRNEGWGAVANEAMANGCVVIGNEKIGSLPYLIKHGFNGGIYKDGCVESAVEQIIYYYKNYDIMVNNSRKAYDTMRGLWNPKTAANNFFDFASNLIDNHKINIEEGPMSIASKI